MRGVRGGRGQAPPPLGPAHVCSAVEAPLPWPAHESVLPLQGDRAATEPPGVHARAPGMGDGLAPGGREPLSQSSVSLADGDSHVLGADSPPHRPRGVLGFSRSPDAHILALGGSL